MKFSILRMNEVVLGLLLVIELSANPIYHHQFNQILDSNLCIKNCMNDIHNQEQELNLLKTTNDTGYLLNIKHICGISNKAKECIDLCKSDSNPFALESMQVLCQQDSLQEINQLKTCLDNYAVDIAQDCENICGDYDAITNEIQRLSENFKPEVDNNEKSNQVMLKINEGCGVMKCSKRCAFQEITLRCDKTQDGRNSGAVFRQLIESVLNAQKRDLDKLSLSDSMNRRVPPQCNYMYMPEIMFNERQDKVSLQAIEEPNQENYIKHLSKIINKEKNIENQDDAGVSQLSHLKATILSRKLALLQLEENNAKRKSAVIDMELAAALRRLVLIRRIANKHDSNSQFEK